MANNIKKIMQTIWSEKNNWKIQLLKNWPNIIGNLKSKVRLEKIQNDTLILGVYDSCLLQELYLLSPVLLKTINEKLEKPHIKRLRFKQAGIKKTKKEKVYIKKTKTEKNIELTKKEKEILKKIKDPDLEKALIKFLTRCHQENDLE